MHFHIVTPSFNQLEYLKRCVASVRDQIPDGVGCRGLGVESGAGREPNPFDEPLCVRHHIQDAESADGTPDWLSEYVSKQPSAGNYRLSFSSEADEGMYDAINRGWRRAGAGVDVVAHLNCDEQYFPGALQKVAGFFDRHETAGVVHADVVVAKPNGSYVCSRRAVLPSRNHILTSHLPTFTASTFIRLQVLREHRLYFDCAWKACGDAEWALRRIEAGIEARVLREYTTAFVDSGENMGLGEHAVKERLLLFQSAAPPARWMKGAWVLRHRLGKWVAGGYSRRPFDYEIYQDTPDGLKRIPFHVRRSSGIWKERL